jgi:type VI secretion system protein ImpB
MNDSFQQRRKRQRPARVNITYDVETGGAMVKKELPFVMGVLADLSGDGADQLPELADREFVEVRPDNFDKVLKGMKPKLQFAVDNKLEEGATDRIGVELEFAEFADFSPERVAGRVEPLKKLLDKRKDLADLKGKLATNRKLNKLLQHVLADEESKAKLRSELEGEGGEHGAG